MKRPYIVWYVVGLLLALAPVGFRVMAWRSPEPAPVDQSMARAGQELFEHEWTTPDSLTLEGDGLGPVYNANSCVACHNQGGVGGSGGVGNNVTTFIVQDSGNAVAREGVVHAFAVGSPETLADIAPGLPRVTRPSLADLNTPPSSPGCKPPALIRMPPGVHVSQRNTPALFGANLIDALPDRVIIAGERNQRLKWGMASAEGEDVPVGRASRLADGRIGKFGWKAQSASLSDFVQAACANELGLGNPGQDQPKPLNQPDYQVSGLDLTLEQCNQLTAFVASLPRPEERIPDDPKGSEDAAAGKRLFGSIGCADCHTPDLGPAKGVYSDLLLHRMGEPLIGGGSYGGPPPRRPDLPPGSGPHPSEWRTPPLWGVADSGPYLHDGRANTLEQAIGLHFGQAARSSQKFQRLGAEEKVQLVAFLKALRAP